MYGGILILSCLLIAQSCTTQTKANEANNIIAKAQKIETKAKVEHTQNTQNTHNTQFLNKKNNPTKVATANVSALKWYSINEVEQLQAKQPKKIIVDLYTSWCRWCQVMDQKTFTDAALVEYLNDNYYMVKFNAETKSEVLFKGKTYGYQSKGRKGYNTLAAELSQGKLSYPSFVVLDEKLNTLKITRGFQTAPQFKQSIESANSI